MNRKSKKLRFILSKNRMKAKGYTEPKWVLENHRHPTKWRNTYPTILEELWVIDVAM